jgi:hypothetical protein
VHHEHRLFPQQGVQQPQMHRSLCRYLRTRRSLRRRQSHPNLQLSIWIRRRSLHQLQTSEANRSTKRPMQPVTLRPQQLVPSEQRRRRLLLSTGPDRKPSELPSRMHRQRRMSANQGLSQQQMRGSVPGNVRHQRQMSSRQPQPHLQLHRRHERRSVHPVRSGHPAGTRPAVRTESVRSEFDLSGPRRESRLHVSRELRGGAPQLSARVHHQSGVFECYGVYQSEVSRSVSGQLWTECTV